jgi:hypothetical protein
MTPPTQIGGVFLSGQADDMNPQQTYFPSEHAKPS